MLETDLAVPPGRLFTLARQAIADHLDGQPVAPVPGPPSQGVFVTLWGPGRELRGCVGRMQPTTDSLLTEVAGCAASAATQDPRFAPLALEELDGLHLEISLLGAEEPVRSAAELDPRRYGVVVRQGGRAGVLLSEVSGVETAEQQVAIAMRKGGIDPSRPYALHRFAVTKLREPAGSGKDER